MARETERNEMIARLGEEEEIGDDMSLYSERSTHRSDSRRDGWAKRRRKIRERVRRMDRSAGSRVGELGHVSGVTTRA